jgi:hypothetical protein
MTNPSVTRPSGELAATTFGGMFDSEIGDREQFVEEGELIRLNTPEQEQLLQRYLGLLGNLPAVLDRSTFRNRVASMLYNHQGSNRERQRVLNLAGRLDGAFQTTLLPPGVQLGQQQATQSPTGFDLSNVKDAASGAEVFRAIVGTHLADSPGFNVNVPADHPHARYNGQRVRLTGPETNRIKSLIDELFREVKPDQVVPLRAVLAEVLQQAPNDGYERDVKFGMELTGYLERSFQRRMAG